MTQYNTGKQVVVQQDPDSAKEKRKAVLAQVRKNRALLYERLRKEGEIQ